MAHISSESSQRLEPNEQVFFRLLEALELKCREKSSLRLSQGFFLSKATEVITNEQNHSTTLSSLNG